MIDTKKFYIVDPEGYDEWSSADCKRRLCYSTVPKVQIHYDEEEKQYFIVQKRKKSRRK